tara:strand:+ start:185 stop:469 length:285 start_codon:yes stop_codon:yes gene_type:complete
MAVMALSEPSTTAPDNPGNTGVGRRHRRFFAITTVEGPDGPIGYLSRPNPQSGSFWYGVIGSRCTGSKMVETPIVKWADHLVIVDMATGSQVGA